MKTIISVCVLTVSVFAGASTISAASPSGPADLQVAQQYGRIDHSSLMSNAILPAPNPAPAAVAAYETPPQ